MFNPQLQLSMDSKESAFLSVSASLGALAVTKSQEIFGSSEIQDLRLDVKGTGKSGTAMSSRGPKTSILETDSELAACFSESYDERAALSVVATKARTDGDIFSSLSHDISKLLGSMPESVKPNIEIRDYEYYDMKVPEIRDPKIFVSPNLAATNMFKTSLAYQSMIIEQSLAGAIAKALAHAQATSQDVIVSVPLFTTMESYDDQLGALEPVVFKAVERHSLISTSSVLIADHKDSFNSFYRFNVGGLTTSVIVHMYRMSAATVNTNVNKTSNRDVTYEFQTYLLNPIIGIKDLGDSVRLGMTSQCYDIRRVDNVIEGSGFATDRSDTPNTADYTVNRDLAAIRTLTCASYVDGIDPTVLDGINQAKLICLDTVAWSVSFERLVLKGIHGSQYINDAYAPKDGALLRSAVRQAWVEYFQKDINLIQFDNIIAGIFGSIAAGMQPVACERVIGNERPEFFLNGYYYATPTTRIKLVANNEGFVMLRSVERNISATEIIKDVRPHLTKQGVKAYHEVISSHRSSTGKIMTQTRSLRPNSKNMLVSMACYDFSTAKGDLRTKYLDAQNTIGSIELL